MLSDEDAMRTWESAEQSKETPDVVPGSKPHSFGETPPCGLQLTKATTGIAIPQ